MASLESNELKVRSKAQGLLCPLSSIIGTGILRTKWSNLSRLFVKLITIYCFGIPVVLGRLLRRFAPRKILFHALKSCYLYFFLLFSSSPFLFVSLLLTSSLFLLLLSSIISSSFLSYLSSYYLLLTIYFLLPTSYFFSSANHNKRPPIKRFRVFLFYWQLCLRKCFLFSSGYQPVFIKIGH